MPATTPRGYPYSLPADPADVPGAIQDLAEAIDVDAQAVADSIGPREAFRMTGLEPLFVPTGVPFTVATILPFTALDFSVGGATPALGPLTEITPQLPGYYWIEASVTYPRDGTTDMDLISLSLQTGSGTLSRTSVHVPPTPSDGNQNLEIHTGAFFNGSTTYVQAVLTTHAAVLTPGNMRVRGRYLSMQRMTTS